MFKNFIIIRNMRWPIFISGLVSAVFGVAVYLYLPEYEHNLNMLMGMFTGFGAACIAISILGFVRNARMSSAQKKQEEIDFKDERNVMIRGKVSKISSINTIIFFTVVSFVMIAVGNRTAAYLCIAGLYVQLFSQVFAQMYYQKKL